VTYAADTKVPVARSRAEIDVLLKKWGCDGIQWTDAFRDQTVTLRFVWTWEGVAYRARLQLHLPTDVALRKQFPRSTASQLPDRRLQCSRALHRLLLLTLKAQLHAVDAGLVTGVEMFLPFLENGDGQTVAELVIPRLRALPDDHGGRLLEGS
jgi:hypothetical protein